MGKYWTVVTIPIKDQRCVNKILNYFVRKLFRRMWLNVESLSNPIQLKCKCWDSTGTSGDDSAAIGTIWHFAMHKAPLSRASDISVSDSRWSRQSLTESLITVSSLASYHLTVLLIEKIFYLFIILLSLTFVYCTYLWHL